MITSPQSRIDHYTEQAWWGNDTLHSLLAVNAKQHPDRIAVADQPNRESLTSTPALRITYAELELMSDNLAERLLELGVSLEHKIVVQLPNVAELVVVYYAASKIGAIVSPVPVQYGKHELASVLETLQATTIITASQFKELNLANNALALSDDVLSFGAEVPATAKPLVLQSEVVATPRLQHHRQLHAMSIDDANQVFTICWTSGTTGTPKGVPRSHNMWLATTMAEVGPCDFRAGDKLLNPFPLVNMAALGGFLFPAAKLACSLFLHHPLEPAVFLQQMQDEQITFTIAPPPLLNQLAKAPEMWAKFDFSKLRRVGSGSAPLAAWMIETFSQQYAIEVINFYGSNEGICLLSTDQTSPQPEQRASMFPRLGAAQFPWQGAMYDFVKTRVVDIETGLEITDAATPGELLIDGPTVFDGYYGDASSAAGNDDVFSDDGFFRTGDLVEICADAQGQVTPFYRIVGRCKDIINRGGVKLSPAEIDSLLEGHPALKEVAVCAYADDRLGEKVCACVVLVDPQQVITLAQLTDYLDDLGVAKYKLPERIEFFDALPRNAMAKVLRFELQRLVSLRS